MSNTNDSNFYKSASIAEAQNKYNWDIRELNRYADEMRELEKTGKYSNGKLILKRVNGIPSFVPGKYITDNIKPIVSYEERKREIDAAMNSIDEDFVEDEEDGDDSDKVSLHVECVDDEYILALTEEMLKEDEIDTEKDQNDGDNNVVDEGSSYEKCAGDEEVDCPNNSSNVIEPEWQLNDVEPYFAPGVVDIGKQHKKKRRGRRRCKFQKSFLDEDYKPHCGLCSLDTSSYGPMRDVSMRLMTHSSANSYGLASTTHGTNYFNRSQKDLVYLFNLCRGGVYAPHVSTYAKSHIDIRDLQVFTDLRMGFINHLGQRVYCYGIYDSTSINVSNYTERSSVQYVPHGVDWLVLRFSDGQTFFVNIKDGVARFRIATGARCNYYIEQIKRRKQHYYSYMEHAIVVEGAKKVAFPFETAKHLDRKLSYDRISLCDVTAFEKVVDFCVPISRAKKRLSKSTFLEMVKSCAYDGVFKVSKLYDLYIEKEADFSPPCLIYALSKMGINYLQGEWCYTDVLYQKSLCPRIRSTNNPCMCVERYFCVPESFPPLGEDCRYSYEHYSNVYATEYVVMRDRSRKKKD